MAEHSAVNRRVVGSSPTWGSQKHIIRNRFSKSEMGSDFFLLSIPMILKTADGEELLQAPNEINRHTEKFRQSLITDSDGIFLMRPFSRLQCVCFLHKLQIKTVQHRADRNAEEHAHDAEGSPPIVTAIKTSSPGRPTDLPTTFDKSDCLLPAAKPAERRQTIPP